MRGWAVARNHREFFHVDLERDWDSIPGYPPGFASITLTDTLDPKRQTGRRTRVLRIDPGVVLTRQVVHDHCEEVFLFQGDLVVGCDETGAGGEVFTAPTYAIRPANIRHGPFSSRAGCLMFESHYYEAES